MSENCRSHFVQDKYAFAQKAVGLRILIFQATGKRSLVVENDREDCLGKNQLADMIFCELLEDNYCGHPRRRLQDKERQSNTGMVNRQNFFLFKTATSP